MVGRGLAAAAAVSALAVGAVGAAASSGSSSVAPAQPAAKPNIVVIETDDQTVESLRVMPNVRNLLAAHGTTFDNSFASYALCCPSRATFLTGQYAHNHTVLGNRAPTGGHYKLDHANALPVWLQRAGYYTTQLGKFLNQYGTRNPREIPPGWSEWHASVDPTTYRFYGYTLNEGGALATFGNDAASYQTDVYAAKAVEIIRRRVSAQQPLFLWFNPLAPHGGGPRDADDPRNLGTPSPAPRHKDRFAAEALPAPPSLNEADMSDKASFMRRRPLLTQTRLAAIRENYQQRLESLLAVDEAVGSIVAALRTSGELDRTLIIFTSDNGFFHGEHRIALGKVLYYEPSIRVPLILRGPGVPKGRHARQLVANIDLAPTIVDAANARPGRRMDGRSLLPLARDRGLEPGRDILIERGPDAQNPGSVWSAIRSRNFLFAQYANGEQELYDLARDPHQLASQHANPAYARVKASLSARLTRLRACAGAACRARPQLGLALSYRAGPRRCTRSSVRATVTGADRRLGQSAAFSVNGRHVATDRRAPFAVTIKRSRLSRARASLVRVRVGLAFDRLATVDRAVRACRR